MSVRRVDFDISSLEAGQRFDQLVVLHVEGLGRKGAALLFASGDVTVDGRRAKKGELARVGQRVSVLVAGDARAIAEPDAELRLLLVREDLVIVDKRAGQPCAALPGAERGTVAGALLAHFPEMASVGYGLREPGLVHRLDTQTSGVLMAARTQTAFAGLRRALGSGALDKRYLAVVESERIDDHGVIEAALGPHPRNARKVSVAARGSPGARAARSEYQVIERKGRFALVEVRAGRAYRHQVRVHLASRGSPLVGDALYGGLDANLGARHALHASYVAGVGEGVPAFAVTAPLPEDMAALLRSR